MAKIKELIANKVCRLQDIISITGATTGCGACEYDVATFVEQQVACETDNLPTHDDEQAINPDVNALIQGDK